ncbi:hypothetical protein ACOMHN_008753 [Nucella lapillus]
MFISGVVSAARQQRWKEKRPATKRDKPSEAASNALTRSPYGGDGGATEAGLTCRLWRGDGRKMQGDGPKEVATRDPGRGLTLDLLAGFGGSGGSPRLFAAARRNYLHP